MKMYNQILAKNTTTTQISSAITSLIMDIGIRYNDTAEAAICRNLVLWNHKFYLDIETVKNKVVMTLYFPKETMILAKISGNPKIFFNVALASKQVKGIRRELLELVDKEVYMERKSLRILFGTKEGILVTDMPNDPPFGVVEKTLFRTASKMLFGENTRKPNRGHRELTI